MSVADALAPSAEVNTTYPFTASRADDVRPVSSAALRGSLASGSAAAERMRDDCTPPQGANSWRSRFLVVAAGRLPTNTVRAALSASSAVASTGVVRFRFLAGSEAASAGSTRRLGGAAGGAPAAVAAASAAPAAVAAAAAAATVASRLRRFRFSTRSSSESASAAARAAKLRGCGTNAGAASAGAPPGPPAATRNAELSLKRPAMQRDRAGVRTT